MMNKQIIDIDSRLLFWLSIFIFITFLPTTLLADSTYQFASQQNIPLPNTKEDPTAVYNDESGLLVLPSVTVESGSSIHYFSVELQNQGDFRFTIKSTNPLSAGFENGSRYSFSDKTLIIPKVNAFGSFYSATLINDESFVFQIQSVELFTTENQIPLSDFAPPSGKDSSQDGEEGPWARRLLSAYSDDGITWQKTNQLVSDQADVADIVVDDKGWIYMYYYGWTVGEFENVPAMAISMNNGASWIFKYLVFTGLPGSGFLSDPHIVYENGLFTMYGTSKTANSNRKILTAESSDGINFKAAGTGFEITGQEVGTVTTFKLNELRYLISLASFPDNQDAVEPGSHWYAKSQGGAAFELINTISFPIDNSIYTIGNPYVFVDGVRLYVFGPAPNPIRSFFSSDAESWTLEEHIHLSLDEGSGMEKSYIGEPSVVRLSDGRYFMVYSTLIP